MNSLCWWHSGPLAESERKLEAASYMEDKSFYWVVPQLPQTFTESPQNPKSNLHLQMGNTDTCCSCHPQITLWWQQPEEQGWKPCGINWEDKALQKWKSRVSQLFHPVPPLPSILSYSTPIHSVFWHSPSTFVRLKGRHGTCPPGAHSLVRERQTVG